MPAKAAFEAMAIVVIALVAGATYALVVPLFGLLGYFLMLLCLYMVVRVLLRRVRP